MKVIVVLDVDENTCKAVAETDNINDAVSGELGWLHDSGMTVERWVPEQDGAGVDDIAFLASVRTTLAQYGQEACDAEPLLRKLRAAIKNYGTWVMIAEAAGAVSDLLKKRSAKSLLALTDEEFIGEVQDVAEESVRNAMEDWA